MFIVCFTIDLNEKEQINDSMRFLADDMTDVIRKINGYYLPPIEGKSFTTDNRTAEAEAVKAGLDVPNMWITSILETPMAIINKNNPDNASK